MHKISDFASKVRSKNAGPFTPTIDIFCDTAAGYHTVCDGLSTARVAALYGQQEKDVKRFDLDALNVIKFSMPRPTVQGSLQDRDMHASQWSWLLADLHLNL